MGRTLKQSTVLIRTDRFPQAALSGSTLKFEGEIWEGSAQKYDEDNWWSWSIPLVAVKAEDSGKVKMVPFHVFATYKSVERCRKDPNWDTCGLDFLAMKSDGSIYTINKPSPNCQIELEQQGNCTVDLPAGAYWSMDIIGSAFTKGETAGVIISAGLAAAALVIAVGATLPAPLAAGTQVATASTAAAAAGTTSSFATAISSASALPSVASSAAAGTAAAGTAAVGWKAVFVAGATAFSATVSAASGLATGLTAQIDGTMFANW